MKVKIGISARHIHLTEEDYNLLFDEPLTKKVDINQPGQFACNQTVNLINGDKKMENVRIIGPLRPYTQVEISRTDAHKLGLNPPVVMSGHLENAEYIKIETKKATIERKSVILSARHIHITPDERKEFGLEKDVYSVKIPGEKGGIMNNVFISESPNSYYEMHIDTDDANAFLLETNDEVEILN